ncbi:MAG TPA: 2-oxoglutarate dehydrogenase E1 component, partial [Rhizobium sp.]|nr:2-oxoglutarate dehydrogenase E1 component [Rhizobium sp.]
GHYMADIDPLEYRQRSHPELTLEFHGLTLWDLDREFPVGDFGSLGGQGRPLRDILAMLRDSYSRAIGVEYMHIDDEEQRAWIQEQFERPFVPLPREEHLRILDKLNEAEVFETFLQTKFVGQKRFSLEGSESAIVFLDEVCEQAADDNIEEVVIGMPHRGRLNVLANIVGKSYGQIFREFEGDFEVEGDVQGSGDVKYHLGASSDREFDGNKVHLSLTANPSHLEIVNPVVMGKARAKQDQLAKVWDGDVIPLKERAKVLPLLLHGDAAFAGQGVVAEILGLSGLRGHRVAGTMHVIINNQIGFTTNPGFSRSSPYPSDVAKMIEAPIFHVNGDDPEAVVYAAKVATEFRMKFHKPVVVDMFCYRRFGHNEGDEPSFTQPKMYKEIRAHKTVVQVYGDRLIAEGVISEGDLEKMRADWRAHLEQEFEAGQSYKPNKADWLDGVWSGLRAADNADEQRRGKTAVPMKTLKEIGRKLSTIPEGFSAHRTIQRFMDNRAQMVETGEGIDWAMAEALAFGSTVLDGHKIRLSGQDCERGTFSQRHSVLYDQETEDRYIPLANLAPNQARYEVINSMLSEEAVLGFEYGYSLARPNALTLWEAQFGDFANGAQVVFDQFISSGERKWLRMSGLVCLLPHGYEGQGPEHSSARLERWLQMCAEDNMQVANVTTPSNYFHILRRQVKRDFRKPLILMTPKSLLRHKRATSTLAEMAGESSFHRLLWDDAEIIKDGPIKLQKDAKIRRVVMCSGKVYYDLLEEREKRGIDDVYLLRIEQLYPFPAKALINELSRFRNAEMVWCQEEPKNMGAWSFIDPYLEWVLAHIDAKYQRVRYTGRPAAASPATGLMSKHLAQLEAFLEDALGG